MFSPTTLQRRRCSQPQIQSSMGTGWSWVTQLQDLSGARPRWRTDLVWAERGVLTPVTWVSQGRMGNFLQAPTPEGRLGCLKTLRLVFRGAGLESDTGGRADS